MSRETILKKLSKKLPEGSFYSLDEAMPLEVFPSGISTLDYASGIGGYPRGWMTMIYGPSSSGKSAMVFQAIGNCHKNDPDALCAIIDVENSAGSIDWATKFGVDPERLVVVTPSTIDETITMTMDVIDSNAFDLIMVDSLGAGILQSEVDNDKARMAGSAGAITRMVKSVQHALNQIERRQRSGEEDIIKPAVILINQVRTNLNSRYGEDTYSGGKALTHMMGMIIHLRTSKASADKIEGTVDGNKMRVGWMCTATVEKNKVAVPGKSAGYVFIFKECPEYEHGIDNGRSVADLAITTGVATVEKKSIYFPTPSGEIEKVVGREKFRDRIREDEELMTFLAESISKITSQNVIDKDAELVKLREIENGLSTENPFEALKDLEDDEENDEEEGGEEESNEELNEEEDSQEEERE